MKRQGINRKRLTAFVLSFLLVMQQSLAYQVFAQSTITDGAGNTIGQKPGGGYEFRPDAVNGDVGFKQFQDFILGKGDVANFIYQWMQKTGQIKPDGTIKWDTKFGDINTFINLVDGQVNINGIVNALQQVGGSLKNDGNLVFISPQGMVVGASGVLNVGSLSVITPSQNGYDSLKSTLNLPAAQYIPEEATVVKVNPDDPSTWTIHVDKYSDYRTNVQNVSTTLDLNSITPGNEAGNIINIDGAVIARGNVDLKGGNVAVGNGGLLVAGVNGHAEALKTEDAAKTLFDSLVKTDNMTSGNEFASTNGKITIVSKTGTSIADGGIVRNYGNGDITITNSGNNGIKIAGELSNPNGTTNITNNAGGLLVASTGVIKSGAQGNNGNSNLLVYNDGNGGIDIQGKVNINHGNKTNTVQFTNKNSNMTLGHASNKDNISSNADVNINITNGNLLNNGVTHNLIATTNGANLNLDVTNGAIGEEVGPNDGVYTGIGTTARDLSKSVNVSIDGKIKATSTQGTNKSVINLASLDKNMNVDQIKADGRVILLADDSTNKGQTPYDIINASSDPSKPNVEGAGISLIASGNIGEDGNALTFRQNNGSYGTVDDQLNHTDNAKYGVDMLAIKDINVKGMDADNGDKLDTNVGGLISREGSINAEFSGDTYIRETTANNEINLTTRGKNMYIENLGEVPTYPQDYYGPNENVHPDKVKITALDLGTSWPDDPADSTIIIKNGTIEGQGQGRPAHEQDLTLVADNAYAGGYHFHMGKDRGKVSDDPLRFNPSYVEEDARTNKMTTPEGETVSIRAKAVRPNDVTDIGLDESDRNYYYGGSSQGGDEGYDGVNNEDLNGTNDPDKQGTEEDDDNLVVPKDDEEVVDTDNDTDTDVDTDTDTDTDIDIDTDTDTDTDVDTDTDTDTDIDTDTDVDTDTDTDTDIDTDTDTDTDVDTDTDIDVDTDTDTDVDTDTDIDVDTDTDTDVDTDTDIDVDTDTDTDVDTDTDIDVDTDTDTDTDEPDIPDIDLGKEVYKQRVVSDRVDSIDKRQYMRFGGEETQDLITFESTDDVIAISDISRGGVSLKHNKKLKVGDIVPVHLSYGDLEINANVKIVSASDVKAGGQFIDLDQATANKLLYLSLIEKDQPIAQTIQNSNITTTIEE